MGLDCALADIQGPGDPLVVFSLGDEREDFQLSVRELFFTDPVGQLRGDFGRDERLPVRDASAWDQTRSRHRGSRDLRRYLTHSLCPSYHPLWDMREHRGYWKIGNRVTMIPDK